MLSLAFPLSNYICFEHDCSFYFANNDAGFKKIVLPAITVQFPLKSIYVTPYNLGLNNLILLSFTKLLAIIRT